VNFISSRWVVATFVGTALGLASLAPAAAATPATTTILYTPIPLTHCPTCPLSSNYVNPPSGSVTLGGVPFSLTAADWIAPGGSDSYTMATSTPTAVYLLINTANGWTSFAGQTLGRVRLTFSDGTTRDTALIVGANVREWAQTSGSVNTLTDPNAKNVWTGTNVNTGGAGVIDMLTIPVAATTAQLTGVTVTDTATSTLYYMIEGLTVAYDPVVPTPTKQPKGEFSGDKDEHETTGQSESHDGHADTHDGQTTTSHDGHEGNNGHEHDGHEN
jgi:hypothetical protein